MKQILYLISLLLLSVGCSRPTPPVFEAMDSEHTGMEFVNSIIENDSLNYYNFAYIYMGGGVAIGDFNRDGLDDVFLTANMKPNKLYLNKGDEPGDSFRFEDITQAAGVAGDQRWYSGATVADVNADGWLDIYVCVAGKYNNTKNQLYINNKDNTFSEKAEEYGLADAAHSIQATFFDYDQDGLLDVFVANYPVITVSLGNAYYHQKMQENKWSESGHLYKNTGDNTFVDVTEEAGVKNFGLTLGVVSQDFNDDGLVDLYLSNDFNVPDYFYINNGDGTFTERMKESFRQTSQFGMGIDAGDFNNDGLLDLVQLDMTPADYKRAKTNMASMSPESFYEGLDYGFHYQYMQNSLQMNNGTTVDGLPHFSNVARIAGVATTDWSWGVLLSDLDNDGHKDLFVTNGMKRDVNNNDVNEQFKSKTFFEKRASYDYKAVPSNPIDNFVFKNEGDFHFKDVTKEWGLSSPGFSNGMAYADLDNDGDLDLVINNLDEKVSVYKNNTNSESHHFFKVKLQGPDNNPFGIDSKVKLILSNGNTLTQQLSLTRGFQSSMPPVLLFGLGDQAKVRSLKVTWPDGQESILNDLDANEELIVKYKPGGTASSERGEGSQPFIDITDSLGINFTHHEDPFNDFAKEPLLPHKNSQLGPALAVGDVDGDGLDDFFVGNAAGSRASLFVQNKTGGFSVMPGPWEAEADREDTGALLFDADSDGDLDLYIVSGGNDPTRSGDYYQDRLFVQTNHGFKKVPLPTMPTSGLKVVAQDFDADGRVDLFVGGRISPGNYPVSPKSYLLKNVGGKDLNIRYQDITAQAAPDLQKAGMVTAALWMDFDQDGWQDLILAGEWSPFQFYRNNKGRFQKYNDHVGLKNSEGWWYGLVSSDVDGDGDQDLIAGNLGLNYKYHASLTSPFEIYANDFDENGTQDIVLSYEKSGKRLPLRGKQCSTQQVPALEKRFETYADFADASLEDIYGKKMLDQSLHLLAYSFSSSWLENRGDGQFVKHDLERVAQLSAINQIVPFDFNNDAFPDFLLAGNLYGSEVETPRNDAGTGLVMLGGPNGPRQYLMSNRTGLMMDGEVRGIVPITLGLKHRKAFVVAANDRKVRILAFSQ